MQLLRTMHICAPNEYAKQYSDKWAVVSQWMNDKNKKEYKQRIGERDDYDCFRFETHVISILYIPGHWIFTLSKDWTLALCYSWTTLTISKYPSM